MNATPPKLSFGLQPISLPMDKILPVRQLRDLEKNLHWFQTILASIRVVGLLEPLSVHPQKGSGLYTLADGHLRYHALKELKKTEALCLIASDDESFTYNQHVNFLAPIQAHKMISRAVKNGVSAERIAEALHVKVELIHAKMNLLVGIHEEVADLLKDKQIPASVFYIFKRVKPLRQIEMAELMTSANNFSKSYAQALLGGTLKDDLINPEEPKKTKGMTGEEVARMEEEMATISRDFKAVEATYGKTVLHLTLAKGYLGKLLDNANVAKFLTSRHKEYFNEFQRLVSATSL